ncbi:hypothetical protein TanjilG_06184 [Lupinus angustifolius]|uniref:Ribosome-recycling factor, chloroplastic n=1 Tax=Lupinus angustifolius TaxID=3871 RepID=A0A1J7GK51_LUPAN|nr:hypothetical protein TanjilG_06184 [Lupinus angustifolius]
MSMFDSDMVFNVSASNFIMESRRTFAKGRKSKDEAGFSMIEIAPDVVPNIKANAVSLMEAAIGALSAELSKLQTGRASQGLLDHITVEISGMKMPLNRVAVVSVIDLKTLSVNPYDPQAMTKVVTKSCEDSRAMGTIKKLYSNLPKDDTKRFEKEVDDLTKKFIKNAEVCKAKQKEINQG